MGNAIFSGSLRLNLSVIAVGKPQTSNTKGHKAVTKARKMVEEFLDKADTGYFRVERVRVDGSSNNPKSQVLYLRKRNILDSIYECFASADEVAAIEQQTRQSIEEAFSQLINAYPNCAMDQSEDMRALRSMYAQIKARSSTRFEIGNITEENFADKHEEISAFVNNAKACLRVNVEEAKQGKKLIYLREQGMLESWRESLLSIFYPLGAKEIKINSAAKISHVLAPIALHFERRPTSESSTSSEDAVVHTPNASRSHSRGGRYPTVGKEDVETLLGTLRARVNMCKSVFEKQKQPLVQYTGQVRSGAEANLGNDTNGLLQVPSGKVVCVQCSPFGVEANEIIIPSTATQVRGAKESSQIHRAKRAFQQAWNKLERHTLPSAEIVAGGGVQVTVHRDRVQVTDHLQHVERLWCIADEPAKRQKNNPLAYRTVDQWKTFYEELLRTAKGSVVVQPYPDGWETDSSGKWRRVISDGNLQGLLLATECRTKPKDGNKESRLSILIAVECPQLHARVENQMKEWARVPPSRPECSPDLPHPKTLMKNLEALKKALPTLSLNRSASASSESPKVKNGAPPSLTLSPIHDPVSPVLFKKICSQQPGLAYIPARSSNGHVLSFQRFDGERIARQLFSKLEEGKDGTESDW